MSDFLAAFALLLILEGLLPFLSPGYTRSFLDIMARMSDTLLRLCGLISLLAGLLLLSLVR